MSLVAKIACSIDASLLEEVERIRETTGESRSGVIARALRALTRSEQRAHAVRQYVASYRAQPETAADVRVARKVARQVTADLPWDNE